MKLSVGYGFQTGLLEKLACYPEVNEIYGKMHEDIFGGGRWSCTLQYAGPDNLRKAVTLAHQYKLSFNYLLNTADLCGLEQTIYGQKRIRKFLDFLSLIRVDSLTVASPYLLRLIKKQYPDFKVRIGAFAQISSPDEASQWQDLGADILVVSAIVCNRSFEKLVAIRNSVSCELELIANASCLQNCIYERDHMHMLSRGSRSTDPLKGYLIDYCFLHCSFSKFKFPVNFIRSCWIRPEDVSIYENLGYSHFKIVERSCPSEMIIKRVQAFVNRKFDGNLLHLISPVAQISKKHGASTEMRLRMFSRMFRPDRIKVKSLIMIRKYTQLLFDNIFSDSDCPVYIDNRMLDGFLDGLRENCNGFCSTCSYCSEISRKAITINEDYREEVLRLADQLDSGATSSTHWLPPNKKRSAYERSKCN